MVPLYSFLPFLLILLSTSPVEATMTNNLIFKVCKNSSNDDLNIKYNFCITSLQAAPDSPCASLRRLGTISIRLVTFNATNTRCYIKQILKYQKLHPYVKQCLEDCFELYSDALSNVQKADKDYKAIKFQDANIELSSVMDAAITCEQGFTERKGIKSPLTTQNKNLFELSAIALSMINTAQ